MFHEVIGVQIKSIISNHACFNIKNLTLYKNINYLLTNYDISKTLCSGTTINIKQTFRNLQENVITLILIYYQDGINDVKMGCRIAVVNPQFW
jgi:hypothetical protein